MEEKNQEFETKFAEIAKKKEESDKRLLKIEIVIEIYGLLLLLLPIEIIALVEMPLWLIASLFVFGFVAFLIASLIAIKIEQVAGYYKCSNCTKKFVPTYGQTCFSMHMGRTRYLKCPHCGKREWDRKVLSEKD